MSFLSSTSPGRRRPYARSPPSRRPRTSSGKNLDANPVDGEPLTWYLLCDHGVSAIARHGHTAVIHRNYMYVVGGDGKDGRRIKGCEAYDIGIHSHTRTPHISYALQPTQHAE